MKKELVEKILEMYLLGQCSGNSSHENKNPSYENKNPFIGKYVLVRGYDAGVWAGKLIDATPGNVVLEDARMLWKWRCKQGIGLSGIASHGLDESKDIKILETQKNIVITDQRVSTFFECSDEVEKQIREVSVANQE